MRSFSCWKNAVMILTLLIDVVESIGVVNLNE